MIVLSVSVCVILLAAVNYDLLPRRKKSALRAASSLSQEEWEILLHALDCIDEGHEALRAKVRELASTPGPGPVEMAKSVTSRSVKAAEAADEMVRLFLSEAEKCPLLPIEGHVQWTDWITMVLKNCGAWETSRDRAP
jgi:hypothetical protein